jgi:GMP synthase (glutamine-hydrolysing)
MPEKILIVLHQEMSTPGRIGRMLEARGFALDIRKPRFDDPLPTTMDEHFGAMIFGGPMSANDGDDFIKREIDWIGVPLRDKRPFLGICLGAQMMARHLGGRVFAHPEGRVEIGYYPIRPTEHGKALCEWPSHVYHWHRETHDLPAGATLLVSSEHFDCQAFQVGDAAFGIQFHSELTLAMLYRWTTRGAPRLDLPGAQQRDEHFAGRALHDPATRAWIEGFLDLWIARGRAMNGHRA